MKKSYQLFGFAAIAALLLPGCSKDATDDVIKPETEKFTLIITPEEKVEALSDDGTRTYWDEEFSDIKWCKDEKFAFCINGVGHWLTGQPQADGIHIRLGKYDYPDLYEEGVPFLMAGVIPNEVLGNRNEAPKKLELRLKTEQNNGDVTTFDRYSDFLVAAQWVTPEKVEGSDKLSVDKTFKVDGYQFVRPMAVTKYAFPVTNEKLTADEKVESVMLTVVPGEGNDQKLLTGNLYMNIGEVPAKVIDANGQQINLRTPFQSGSPSVGITYPADSQPTLGELVFWPVTAPVKLEAGDMLRFRIVTAKHEITKEIVLTKELYYANDKLNRATVKLDADTKVHTFDEAIDLSADGTANCYIVNKPRSSYKFRADVKGNDATQTIAPQGAVIMWYNCVQPDYNKFIQESPIVLESVKLAEGCIEFSTPETFVNGNVVIAAIDQPLTADQIEVDPATRQLTNANVLWSWNLIVSNGYDPNEPWRQYSKGGVTMMDRDLGAVIDPDASATGFTKAAAAGNTYQWGRKDAFPGIPDYQSLAAYSYFSFYVSFPVIPGLNLGEIGSYAKAPNQIFDTKPDTNCAFIENTYGADYTVDQALEYATQNPHLWVRSSKASWIPANDQSFGLWGKGEQKTVNDPCPAGWRVMSEADWMALSDNLETPAAAFDRFVRMDGQIFPLFEGRNTDSGVLGYSGSCNAKINANYYTGNTLVAGGLLYGRAFNLQAPNNYDVAENDPTATLKMENWAAGRGARIRCVKE